MIQNTIVKYAELFNGLKETGENEGWEDIYFEEIDSTFQDLMVAVGWKSGHAWCAYFAELVWKLAYQDHPLVIELNNLFSASAVQTWKNFSKSDFRTSSVPFVGDVIAWRNYKRGKAQWTGHLGIVTQVDGRVITTIEGNIGSHSDREGDQVGMRVRTISFDKKSNGLNLLGFIHPTRV